MKKQMKLKKLFMAEKLILNHRDLLLPLIVIILNIEVLVMKIKTYQLKNPLMKLDLI